MSAGGDHLYRLCTHCAGVGTIPAEAVHLGSHPENSAKVVRPPRRPPRTLCPTCLGMRFVRVAFGFREALEAIRDAQDRGRFRGGVM
jgi:hypothetical protein